MTDNRTGNQLWEEADIQGVVSKAISGYGAALNVDQVRNLLKGEKTNVQGQYDIEGLVLHRKDQRQRTSEESGIFERAKYNKIQHHAKSNRGANHCAVGSACQQPVEYDGALRECREITSPRPRVVLRAASKAREGKIRP